MSRFIGTRNERGAALVEMAVLATLLVPLLLGMVEFGWKFGQFNDVRHATREGARFAAVSAGDNAAIRNVVCGAMDAVSAGVTQLRVQVDPDLDGDGDVGTGGEALIRVEADVTAIIGVPGISVFLPDTLASEVEFRLEQPATWTADFVAVPVSC